MCRCWGWYVGQRERESIYVLVSVLVSFFVTIIITTIVTLNIPEETTRSIYHLISLLKVKLTPLSSSSQDIELPSLNQLLNNQLLFSQPPLYPKMQTKALMGRGGYNRTSPILGRGGYNRDIKTSGISRPSNPSSLVVRSARVASDDGRGGYN